MRDGNTPTSVNYIPYRVFISIHPTANLQPEPLSHANVIQRQSSRREIGHRKWRIDWYDNWKTFNWNCHILGRCYKPWNDDFSHTEMDEVGFPVEIIYCLFTFCHISSRIKRSWSFTASFYLSWKCEDINLRIKLMPWENSGWWFRFNFCGILKSDFPFLFLKLDYTIGLRY